MARWFRSGLSVSAPFVWRCLNSRSVLRFHVPLIEPDVRFSRIRLSDGRRLQAHAARTARTASPEAQACSGVASSTFRGGNRLAPLSRPLSPSQAHPKSGPFPPPALPGFTGTASLSATPYGPACPSRASGWCLYTTAGASRVASDLLVYVPSPLPRRDRWMRALLSFSNDGGLPRSMGGSAPALPLSRPAQRSLTFRPAYSPGRLATLYTGGFGDVVAYVPAPIATDRSNICRVGLSPTEVPRLFTAHHGCTG